MLSSTGFWLPAETDLAVHFEGETHTPFGWRLWLEWLNAPPKEPPAPPDAILVIPRDAVVRLRTRRNGDRLAPVGLNGHERKLKDWLIDRKIPRLVRDHVPLLTVNGVIAGVLTDSLWYVTNPFKLHYNSVTIQPICRIVTVAKI
jgi:tRNA(Ile)-lysidine synthetase-like protein